MAKARASKTISGFGITSKNAVVGGALYAVVRPGLSSVTKIAGPTFQQPLNFIAYGKGAKLVGGKSIIGSQAQFADVGLKLLIANGLDAYILPMLRERSGGITKRLGGGT